MKDCWECAFYNPREYKVTDGKKIYLENHLGIEFGEKLVIYLFAILDQQIKFG